jgi:hypothetical protein
MNALRKIHKTNSDTVIIKIPEALRYQTLEIIVLPVYDEPTEITSNQAQWPADFFDKFVGCLPDFPEIESEGDYENREVLL